jgi:site-specific DNA recombinase
MLKDRIAELKAIRDQARADAERAEGAIERLGPSITPQALNTFARQARKRMRTENGGYRRDHFRALAQRVEVDAKEVRIMGSKSVLLRTLVAASSAKRQVLACPVLYRSGAPGRTRTSTMLPLPDFESGGER